MASLAIIAIIASTISCIEVSLSTLARFNDTILDTPIDISIMVEQSLYFNCSGMCGFRIQGINFIGKSLTSIKSCYASFCPVWQLSSNSTSLGSVAKLRILRDPNYKYYQASLLSGSHILLNPTSKRFSLSTGVPVFEALLTATAASRSLHGHRCTAFSLSNTAALVPPIYMHVGMTTADDSMAAGDSRGRAVVMPDSLCVCVDASVSGVEEGGKEGMESQVMYKVKVASYGLDGVVVGGCGVEELIEELVVGKIVTVPVWKGTDVTVDVRRVASSSGIQNFGQISFILDFDADEIDARAEIVKVPGKILKTIDMTRLENSTLAFMLSYQDYLVLQLLNLKIRLVFVSTQRHSYFRITPLNVPMNINTKKLTVYTIASNTQRLHFTIASPFGAMIALGYDSMILELKASSEHTDIDGVIASIHNSDKKVDSSYYDLDTKSDIVTYLKTVDRRIFEGPNQVQFNRRPSDGSANIEIDVFTKSQNHNDPESVVIEVDFGHEMIGYYETIEDMTYKVDKPTFLVSSKGNDGFSDSHNISVFTSGCRGTFEWRYIKNDEMRNYSFSEQNFIISNFTRFDQEIYTQMISFPLIPFTSILVRISVACI